MATYFELLDQHFKIEAFKANTYSPVTLAYIGDSIYDLVVRTVIMSKGNKAVGKMHKEASKYVNAKAQAKMYYAVEGVLTEEEKAAFRRGRNAKQGSTPKNADLNTYKHATGMEAVLGFLYLNQDLNRIMFLISLGLEAIDEG